MKSNPGIKLTLLAAIVGMTLAAWSTRLGPGVGGDATIYLTSAQNLAKGIGLGLVQPDGSFRLLPYSAPLFPLILSPFSAVQLDLTVVSRWFNILLFGGLIFLIGFSSLKAFGGNWIAILPAWLAACSPILLPVYSWAMAEPVTMLLGFAGLILILGHLDEPYPNRWSWPEWAGLLLGLAAAARYSAAAFLAAGAVICLFWPAWPFYKRLLTAFRTGLVGIIPLGIWVLVQIGQTASVSARSMLTIAEMGGRFMLFWPQFVSAMLVWLLPASFQEGLSYPMWIQAVPVVFFLFILAAGSIWVNVKGQNKLTGRLVNMLWIFAGIYSAVLLLVYLTTYPPITIDNRMLSPVHIAVIWIAAVLLISLWGEPENKTWQIVFALAMLVFVGWYGWRTVRIVRQNAETGLGYNSIAWQQSKIIAAVKAIPESQNLVTNETMALLYLTGRVAKPVGEIYADKPVYPFSRYGDGPEGNDPAEAEFKKGDSLLVVFNSLENQFESIYGDRAKERAETFVNGLRVDAFGDDGAIYDYPVDYSK
ncbi:hypothetical protein [Leptolinea tardivitalis]|uniref:Glycosyltransferase RgtA/B/C/D-like domain-containing protein n=1 Tax=Leptolinea tardivitalis TaxID=229920 RepID=A0A0P6WYH5_9CHLR|nr:hypothetical protein [Leptolinea tardivitalis]KPL71641.1 hypothetical protein ADM99_09160 [Leptolinea tardivitalis]GAP19970.1 hypothetical protein LTAR_00154 [Leptolinea tardivitalis]